MESRSIYNLAKNAFLEESGFITFESNLLYLQELHELMQKPFKLALLYGPPGVGKTFLLRHFIQEKEHKNIHLVDTPLLFEKHLERTFGIGDERELFDTVSSLQERHIFLLDEAQLYTPKQLETIRMLSDIQKVSFLLCLHQNEEEELITKEHFQTRIFKEIEMQEPKLAEFGIYIQKRLLGAGLPDLAKSFDKSKVKFIYRFTKGNFRQTNKFLYNLFDILEYYDIHHPTKVDRKKIQKKFLEMSALFMGYIDA